MLKVSYDKVLLTCAERATGITAAFRDAKLSDSVMSRIKAGQEIREQSAGKLAKSLDVSVKDILDHRGG